MAANHSAQENALIYTLTNCDTQQDKPKGGPGRTHPGVRTKDGGWSLEAIRRRRARGTAIPALRVPHWTQRPTASGTMHLVCTHVECNVSRDTGKTNRLGRKKRGCSAHRKFSRQLSTGGRGPQAGEENEQ